MANPFDKTRLFLGETVTELKKANWPNREELRASTLVVLIAIVLFGAVVAIFDFSVFNWVQLLTNLVD